MGLGSTALSALLLASPTPVIAQTADAVRRYDVAAGPLDRALTAFAQQSGQQILYPAALVAGRRSDGVSGSYLPETALAALLRNSGLTYRRTRPNVFVLVDPAERADTGVEETTVLDEVVVTGSLIRGARDGPSPVVTLTRDLIDRDGHATVAQALAALPQNFGGTANEATIGNGADRTASNATFASGLNLRGLGSDATLVLINGRRMAGTGGKGDFADVSTLPTAAIARIDILLDGASALYGADAVGGVVNIILNDDYDGAETRTRVGGAADGAGEFQFGQTFGRRWSSGRVLGVYEYYDRASLSAADRRLAGDADLRWRGGDDRRRNYSNPGNIVIFDSAAGGYVSRFAIPTGQDGTALRPGDFLAGQSNLSNQRQGMNVLPHQRRHSVYGALNQNLGDRAALSADVRYGRRDFETVSAPFPTVFTVTRANPFFASPNGSSSHLIAYSFAEDLPNPPVAGQAESLGASVGAKVDLTGDWRLDAYLAYASERGESETRGMVNSTLLREALGAIPDNPATFFSAVQDGYFNPFADGSNSSQAVLDFIGSGYSRTQNRTEVSSANLQVDGTVFTLPGGTVKLAAGLSLREETFRRTVDSFTSGVTPTLGVPRQSDRRVSALFGELRLPVFGPDNRRPGFERLELSLAARYEDYGDIGETVSPKVGMVWEPNSELRLRANYGASFRAPALRELNDAASASPTFLPRGSQQVLSMILYGGNPNLEPEQADTWTAGVDYRPKGIDGLRLGANWFRIAFDDRIGQPTFENILTALSGPALSPFVRLVDPGVNAEDRAAVQAILDLPTTGLRDLFPATSYGAIVDARFVNTARVEVEGLDVTGAYAFEVGAQAFDLGLTLTYLDRFDSQATPNSAVTSQLDRPNFPVGLRGRSTLGWSNGDWGASASLNYVDAYRDLEGARIGSWTTADVQVRYAASIGRAKGVAIALNIQNLFDRDPPFYNAPEGIGYDAANANVLGRFISLQLTKAW